MIHYHVYNNLIYNSPCRKTVKYGHQSHRTQNKKSTAIYHADQPFVSQLDQIHIIPPYLTKIRTNIIITSTGWFSRILAQNSIRKSSFSLYHLVLGEECKL